MPISSNRSAHKFYLLVFLPLLLITVSGCGQDTDHDKVATKTPDTAEVRGNAENGLSLSEACSTCHGKTGIDSKDGAPFIAGQQFQYLLNVLNGYRNGQRTKGDMKGLLVSMTDTEIIDLAAYYSSLNDKWNPSRYTKKPKPVKTITKSDISAGKKLSKPCLGCHGINGNSTLPGIPSLAGLQPQYLEAAISAYFSGQRQAPIMKNFRHTTDKKEIYHLAAYFSSLTRTQVEQATSGNARKGKSLSESLCSGCHGNTGNSLSPTIPSLTGQNADYLLVALNAYQTGKRQHRAMQEAVKGLTPKNFVDMIAFYTRQKAEKYEAPKPPDPNRFAPIEDGEALAKSCNGCHGANGNSQLAGTPSLSRLHPDYLSAAITSYANAERKHDLMKSFVQSLTEEDIFKIGLYYASQEPTTSKNSFKGDPSVGESLAASCNGCHGEHGNSTQGSTPSLAGQDALYIVNALKTYKSGKRQHNDMQNAVKDLTADDFNNLAAYYATQQPLKPDIKIPEAPEMLAEKCNRCHGPNGIGDSTTPETPRIAAQIESYLYNTLVDYKNETRHNSAMHAMADVLSTLEMKAVAKYYANQKR